MVKKMKVEKPATKVEKLSLLITYSIPKISTQELFKLLLAYSGKKTHEGTIASTSDLAADVLDSSDKQCLREAEDSYKRASSSEEATKISLSTGSKFLEVLGHGALKDMAVATMKKEKVVPPIKKKAVAWKTLQDRTTAQVYMPTTHGADIYNIPAKRCWTAYYPGAVPGSRTRTWSLKWQSWTVARHCVSWAWQQHTKKTGQQCPWELS